MNLNARTFGVAGSVLGFLGVAFGAFGAHALRGRVGAADLATFETAVRYHLLHALALLAVAWLASREESGPSALAGWSFLAGGFLFSGSLYLMVLTGIRWLGAVTPLGGIAFLVGWLALGGVFLGFGRRGPGGVP